MAAAVLDVAAGGAAVVCGVTGGTETEVETCGVLLRSMVGLDVVAAGCGGSSTLGGGITTLGGGGTTMPG